MNILIDENKTLCSAIDFSRESVNKNSIVIKENNYEDAVTNKCYDIMIFHCHNCIFNIIPKLSLRHDLNPEEQKQEIQNLYNFLMGDDTKTESLTEHYLGCVFVGLDVVLRHNIVELEILNI